MGLGEAPFRPTECEVVSVGRGVRGLHSSMMLKKMMYKLKSMAFVVTMLLTAASVVLAPVPMVQAQERLEEDQARAQMMKLSEDANALFLQGQFAEAAQAFRDAYRIYPDPVLLKNQMIAFYRADRCDDAIAPGQAFLASGEANPTDRHDVQTVLVSCELQTAELMLEGGRLLESQRALARAETYQPEEDQQEKIEAVRARIKEARKDEAAEARTPQQQLPATPVHEVSTELRTGEHERSRVLAYSLLGAGVAALAGGGVMTVMSNDTWDDLCYYNLECESRGELTADEVTLLKSTEAYLEAQEVYEAQRIYSWALYGVGGVLAGTGLVLYMIDERDESADASKVSARVLPFWAGGSVGARVKLDF